MFITKKQLPRRTFLQGAGVTLTLPLLEAMVPAATALAQTPANPKPRFVGVFYPHGMAPGHWELEKEGPLPEKLPFITETLEKVKDQTVVITGLWSKSAEPPEGTTGSDHWVAAAFLTQSSRRRRQVRTRAWAARRSIRSLLRKLVRTICYLQCNSLLKIPIPVPATAVKVIAARTRIPFRGIHRQRRCRWNSTLRWSSSACSEAARLPNYAPPA